MYSLELCVPRMPGAGNGEVDWFFHFVFFVFFRFFSFFFVFFVFSVFSVFFVFSFSSGIKNVFFLRKNATGDSFFGGKPLESIIDMQYTHLATRNGSTA